MTDSSGLSTTQMAQNLASQVVTLVRAELRLARVELLAKARGLAVGVGLLAAAATLFIFAAAVAVAAIVLGLAVVLPAWAAALITAGGLVVLAGPIVLIGRSMLRRAVPPVQSMAMQDVREDVTAVTAAARRD